MHTVTIFSAQKQEHIPGREKRIIVFMVTHNARGYVGRALKSIFSQNYDNYKVLIIDDASNDGTDQYIEDYLDRHRKREKVVFHINNKRIYAPLLYYASGAKICENTDIAVILEPQDVFAHKEVFRYLNNVYQSNNVWMTYGPMRDLYTNSLIETIKIPDEVAALGAYREYLYMPKNLQSFYIGLLNRVRRDALLRIDGQVRSDDCLAAVIPMFEMARSHAKYVPDVLVLRDTVLDTARYHISSDHRDAIEVSIRSRGSYSVLNSINN